MASRDFLCRYFPDYRLSFNTFPTSILSPSSRSLCLWGDPSDAPSPPPHGDGDGADSLHSLVSTQAGSDPDSCLGVDERVGTRRCSSEMAFATATYTWEIALGVALPLLSIRRGRKVSR